MLKLKKLIKEHSWDREFGDPLPTFEDVMEKHQENKFKEDLDSVDKEDDDVDNDGDSDASDDYLKNRRDVISKAIEKEKGNQSKQETLMIDGKQYRIISEDVEKESKLNEALPSWYKDGAKLVKQVMKKNRIKPISGGGMMSSWSSIARKIRSGQEFAYSIKPSHEFAELYHSSLDQNSKKISILAKKLVKDIEKAGMAASFDGDFSIHYRSQDIAESIYEFSEFYKRFKRQE